MPAALPPHLAELLETEVVTFVLILTRIGGLLTFGPLLSSNMMPRRFRFFLALAVSLMIAPVVPRRLALTDDVANLVLALMGELLIALVLGSFLQLIFQGLQLAGQISGTQFGLALASILNPQFEEQLATTSVIYATLGSLIFLATGGHREMFGALLETFEVIPPGGVGLSGELLSSALSVFQESQVFALRVAAPIVVTLLLTELATGVIGRTVPQINLQSMGFSLRILVGITLSMAALPAAGESFLDALHRALDLAYGTLALLGPSSAN